MKGLTKAEHFTPTLVTTLGMLCVAADAIAQTWTQTSAPLTNWTAVASSADGSRLVAAIAGGQIYTSTNSGFIVSNTEKEVL